LNRTHQLVIEEAKRAEVHTSTSDEERVEVVQATIQEVD
jgi:hypothetical protein